MDFFRGFARTKFYIFYWEGKDDDGIDMDNLRPCRTSRRCLQFFLDQKASIPCGLDGLNSFLFVYSSVYGIVCLPIQAACRVAWKEMPDAFFKTFKRKTQTRQSPVFSKLCSCWDWLIENPSAHSWRWFEQLTIQLPRIFLAGIEVAGLHTTAQLGLPCFTVAQWRTCSKITNPWMFRLDNMQAGSSEVTSSNL